LEKDPGTCAEATTVFGPHCCVKCSICGDNEMLKLKAKAGTTNGSPFTCFSAQAWLNSPAAKKDKKSCRKGRKVWAKRCCAADAAAKRAKAKAKAKAKAMARAKARAMAER